MSRRRGVTEAFDPSLPKQRGLVKPPSEVRRLRAALRYIRDQFDVHLDGDDNAVSDEHDCFCVRCVAVRALGRPR